ncbi:hypothetical protein [Bradyrhizobium sp. SZCCHNS3053]|uniref:hypothetical protein n=1 Tax=Bradyrhizobium sp. SZCCHNS3053 TaxID=3057322 RepID=UPI0029162C0E|nr:hypothetical protein [Bradyrhizobium sp. SZCCHNS3053]
MEPAAWRVKFTDQKVWFLWKRKPPHAGDADVNCEALYSEKTVDLLREMIADLRSTMSAWFDLANKTEEAVTPILMDGLKGYLRVSQNGGMPSKLANNVEAVLQDFCRLYVGKALVPVLRGIAWDIKPVTYDHDDKGNIVLPDGAPFDGKPVLIKLGAGWVEARWEPYDRATDSGFGWVVLDDSIAFTELDDAKEWTPLPGGLEIANG